MPHATSTPRESTTLVFDGDCGFCTSSVHWLQRTLPAMPQAIPFQWLELEKYGLSQPEAAERVWLVTTERTGAKGSPSDDSEVFHQYGGYLAVSVTLRHQPHMGWRFLGVLLDTPPFSLLAGIGYSLIARYRYLLPGGTPACKMKPTP